MNLGTKRQESEDRERRRREQRLARMARSDRMKDFILIGAGTLILGALMYALLVLILSIDLGPQPGDGEPTPLPPHAEENR